MPRHWGALGSSLHSAFDIPGSLVSPDSTPQASLVHPAIRATLPCFSVHSSSTNLLSLEALLPLLNPYRVLPPSQSHPPQEHLPACARTGPVDHFGWKCASSGAHSISSWSSLKYYWSPHMTRPLPRPPHPVPKISNSPPCFILSMCLTIHFI